MKASKPAPELPGQMTIEDLLTDSLPKSIRLILEYGMTTDTLATPSFETLDLATRLDRAARVRKMNALLEPFSDHRTHDSAIRALARVMHTEGLEAAEAKAVELKELYEDLYLMDKLNGSILL